MLTNNEALSWIKSLRYDMTCLKHLEVVEIHNDLILLKHKRHRYYSDVFKTDEYHHVYYELYKYGSKDALWKGKVKKKYRSNLFKYYEGRI
jgi:hypothetical protein